MESETVYNRTIYIQYYKKIKYIKTWYHVNYYKVLKKTIESIHND